MFNMNANETLITLARRIGDELLESAVTTTESTSAPHIIV